VATRTDRGHYPRSLSRVVEFDLLTGLSDNVGYVKYFFSTRLRPLGEERHFALLEISAVPNQGSLSISCRSGIQSDPCISSIHNFDHDY
jgi:hypothetical protein